MIFKRVSLIFIVTGIFILACDKMDRVNPFDSKGTEYVDTIPPVISISGDKTDTITVGDSWIAPVVEVSDNSNEVFDMGDVVITGDVDTSIVGIYTIIYTAVDLSKNSVSETLTVVVIEEAAPQLILKDSDSITVTLSTSYIEPGFLVITSSGDTLTAIAADSVVSDTLYDSAGTALSKVYDLGSVEGNFSIKYTLNYEDKIVINWRYVEVVYVDLTKPVITILGNNPDTVLVDSSIAYKDIDSGVVAIDNGTDTVSVTVIDSVNMSTSGIYKIYYSATDSNNNSCDTFRVVVVIEDNEAPVMVLSSKNDTIEVGDVWDSVTVTASDNIFGDLTSSIISTGTVNESLKGVYEVIYSVVDGAGNSASDTVTVYVFALPTITLLGNNPDTVVLNSISYIDPQARVLDNVDDTLFVNGVGSIALDTEGFFTLSYFYTDIDENTTDTLTRTVAVLNIADTKKPVITIVGNNPDTLWVGDNYVDSGATAQDEKDGDLTSSIDTLNQVNTSVAGLDSVIYTVSDAAGNIDTAIREVWIIADNVKPIITIVGKNPDTLWVGETFVDSGATAQDNKDGDLTASINKINQVNTAVAGLDSVIYTVSDAAGNSAVAVREVWIKADTEAPVITINGGNVDTIVAGDSWTNPSATAVDNIDGILNPSNIIVIDTVDNNTVGDYTLTYKISDAAGNEGTATLVVTVKSPPLPVITINGSLDTAIYVDPAVSGTPGWYTIPSFSATDVKDGDLTAQVTIDSSDIDLDTVGVDTIYFSVTNSNSVTATVKLMLAKVPYVIYPGQQIPDYTNSVPEEIRGLTVLGTWGDPAGVPDFPAPASTGGVKVFENQLVAIIATHYWTQKAPSSDPVGYAFTDNGNPVLLPDSTPWVVLEPKIYAKDGVQELNLSTGWKHYVNSNYIAAITPVWYDTNTINEFGGKLWQPDTTSLVGELPSYESSLLFTGYKAGDVVKYTDGKYYICLEDGPEAAPTLADWQGKYYWEEYSYDINSPVLYSSGSYVGVDWSSNTEHVAADRGTPGFAIVDILGTSN